MQIIRVPVGAFITNCYIAEGQEPGRGFLVDPADNPKKLISILEEKQICPEAISSDTWSLRSYSCGTEAAGTMERDSGVLQCKGYSGESYGV